MVTGAAPGVVVPGSVTVLNGLTVNDASGVGLQGDLDVVGTLTLTSGPVATGGATLRVDVAGTVVRTAGRVNGLLEKHVPAGVGVTVAFEIGAHAASYTPASVAFGTVTTAGELTASTTTGEHPAIASSGLAATRDVNRFWTVANGGVAFDTYSATFTFVAGDVDAGAQHNRIHRRQGRRGNLDPARRGLPHRPQHAGHGHDLLQRLRRRRGHGRPGGDRRRRPGERGGRYRRRRLHDDGHQRRALGRDRGGPRGQPAERLQRRPGEPQPGPPAPRSGRVPTSAVRWARWPSARRPR